MGLAHAAGWLGLGLGGLVCAWNICFTLLRPLFLRLAGREVRHTSPAPAIGSILLLVGVAAAPAPAPLLTAAVVVGLLDPGGVHWLLPALAADAWAEKRKKRTEDSER